jgi:hypothetical protein
MLYFLFCFVFFLLFALGTVPPLENTYTRLVLQPLVLKYIYIYIFYTAHICFASSVYVLLICYVVASLFIFFFAFLYALIVTIITIITIVLV